EGCQIEKNCLLQLPTALWLRALQIDNDTVTTEPLDNLLARSRVIGNGRFQFGEYAIDYSYIPTIRNEMIHLSNLKQLDDVLKKFRNRIVLIGDMEDNEDQICAVD